MTSIAVLLTCFNRRATTLRCLESLASQTEIDQVDLRVTVVDDGSTDGTAAAIRLQHPNVELINGTGSLYWTGGMLRADAHVWPTLPDLLLWLNDDVELHPDAIRLLLDAADQTDHRAIVVGAVSDRTTGQTTYGGYRRPDPRRPLTTHRIEPSGHIERLDTMNGNVVLVPAAVRQNVGALDSDFSHNMADLDYGYRASSAGWNVVLASHFVGYCESNTSKARWKDPSLGLRARWAAINSFRGLPVGEWFKFTRRHCGWRWPRYFVSPYVRCLTCGVRGDRARRS